MFVHNRAWKPKHITKVSLHILLKQLPYKKIKKLRNQKHDLKMPGFVALSNHGDLLIRDAFRILLFFTEFSLNFLLRSSHPGVFLGKGVLEDMQQIYRITPISKCDLNSNFIKIALRHGCSPVNLLHFSEHLFIRTLLEGCFCSTFSYQFKKNWINYFMKILFLSIAFIF